MTAGTPNETTVSITDDDLPAVISASVLGGGGATGPTPSVVDFEWTVKRDLEVLESGHDTPSGMWSNGATIWILENGAGADDAVYAYDLSSGERVEGREFVLAAENRAPRGMWSTARRCGSPTAGASGSTPTASRAASARRAVSSIWPSATAPRAPSGRTARRCGCWTAAATRSSPTTSRPVSYWASTASPHATATRGGVWSDGVTIWVSDHGLREIWAYRLPTKPDAPVVEDAGPLALERVDEEDFTHLSGSSNNSPRGIWSDGDYMYVADKSDTRVYSYNTPDAIDARLASMGLSGVDIGEFDPRTRAYRGIVEDGVTQTTVEAKAAQSRASVLIEPADADVAAEGHQMAHRWRRRDHRHRDLAGRRTPRAHLPRAHGKDGGRAVGEQPARLPMPADFSLVIFEVSVASMTSWTCAEGRDIVAVYALHDGTYVPYILEAPDFTNRPGLGDLFADGLSSRTLAGRRQQRVRTTADPFGDDLDDSRRQAWPESLALAPSATASDFLV